jgi:hypothetical protein
MYVIGDIHFKLFDFNSIRNCNGKGGLVFVWVAIVFILSIGLQLHKASRITHTTIQIVVVATKELAQSSPQALSRI